MKIGFMADTYKPHVSGVTNYIALNKRFLEMAGHEVYVFTFGDEEYVDDEPNVIRSPGLPLVDTGFYLSLRYTRRARQLLTSMDIVHVQHPFLSGSLALGYCMPRNIPIVFTNHSRYDLLTQAYLPILPDTFGETAMKAYLPPFCRACDLVISPSQGMANVLRHVGVDCEIKIIPNGVDLDPFRSVIKPIPRSDFNINTDALVFVFVGRIAPEKNLSFLLRAFRGIAEAYQHTHLLLVGDGPDRENLEALAKSIGISNRVHFTGMVKYEVMPSYLAMADIFATASVSEVHPLTIIEAMASGLPALGITSPGIADMIQDGVTGFLSSDDLAVLTAKMARLVAEDDTRYEMSEQARRASVDYDIRITTQLLMDEYKALVQAASYRKNGLINKAARWLNRFTKRRK